MYPDWFVLPSSGLWVVAVIYGLLFEIVLPTLCSHLLMVVFRVLHDDHQDSSYSLPICKDHVLFPVPSFLAVCCTSVFSVFGALNPFPLHVKVVSLSGSRILWMDLQIIF